MSEPSFKRHCMKCDKWATHHSVFAESSGASMKQEWYCDEHAIEAGLAPAGTVSCSLGASSSNKQARMLERAGCTMEAIALILSAVDSLRMSAGDARVHFSAQQLCAAMRTVALERFGNDARGELGRWGLHAWPDVGRAVYAMYEAGVLESSEGDSQADFDRIVGLDDLLRS